jgi:hypothetical protein
MPATGQATSRPATFHVVTQRPLHPAVRTTARRSSSVTAHIVARSVSSQRSDARAAVPRSQAARRGAAGLTQAPCP